MEKAYIKMSEIPQFKDSIIAFFKFTKHIDSLLEGNLYMNNLQCYIDMEIDSGIKGVGDKLEASQVLSQVEFKMYDNETGELAFEGTGESINFRTDGDEKRPVYCLFTLHSENLTLVDENEEFYIAEMNFTDDEVDKMLAEFGEQLIIIDPHNFLQRVDNAFSEKGYEYIYSKVNYDDYSKNSKQRIESYNKNNHEILFWKDKFFENQNEYRIAITNVETDKPMEVNIGDISDICTPYNARELFTKNLQIHLRKKK